MKVVFSSSYNKKLKYKIYAFDGKRRGLLCKGKFLRNTETEIKMEGNQLIVRIQRRNLFTALFMAILAIPLNFINSGGRGSFSSQTTSLFPYEEIKIMCVNLSQDLVIRYEKSPMLKDKKPFEKTVKVNYLSCQTYPYETNLTEKRLINIILYSFAIIFWIALIVGICLLIRFLAIN